MFIPNIGPTHIQVYQSTEQNNRIIETFKSHPCLTLCHHHPKYRVGLWYHKSTTASTFLRSQPKWILLKFSLVKLLNMHEKKRMSAERSLVPGYKESWTANWFHLLMQIHRANSLMESVGWLTIRTVCRMLINLVVALWKIWGNEVSSIDCRIDPFELISIFIISRAQTDHAFLTGATARTALSFGNLRFTN